MVEEVTHAELDGLLVMTHEPAKGVVATIVGEVGLALRVCVRHGSRAHKEVAAATLHDVGVGVGVAAKENGTRVRKDDGAQVAVVLEGVLVAPAARVGVSDGVLERLVDEDKGRHTGSLVLVEKAREP